MRGYLPALDHGVMDPAPALYLIRINGHLGTTVLSAFPALVPQHHGAHTIAIPASHAIALTQPAAVAGHIAAAASSSRPAARPPRPALPRA